MIIKKYLEKEKEGKQQCQNCLEFGHWTYECTRPQTYVYRPSRTKLFKQNKLNLFNIKDQKREESPKKDDKKDKKDKKDKNGTNKDLIMKKKDKTVIKRKIKKKDKKEEEDKKEGEKEDEKEDEKEEEKEEEKQEEKEDEEINSLNDQIRKIMLKNLEMQTKIEKQLNMRYFYEKNQKSIAAFVNDLNFKFRNYDQTISQLHKQQIEIGHKKTTIIPIRTILNAGYVLLKYDL